MRQRAADDVEAIYENIQRLKREREQALNGDGTGPSGGIEPPCDTEQPRMEDYACGWRLSLLAPSRANDILRALMGPSYLFQRTREPGEHTDGA